MIKFLKETKSETKAKRLFSVPSAMKHIKTFAIFTAENPNAQTMSRSANDDRMKDLKSKLSFETSLHQGGYYYYKVKGKYGDTEHSVLVYNILLEDAKDFACKYEQQSFIFGTNDDGKLHFEFWANRKKDGYKYSKLDEKDIVNINNEETEEYYTQISKDFRIAIPFEKFEWAADEMYESFKRKMIRTNSNPSDTNIDTQIMRSLDENITGKYRYYARKTLQE